jgi:carbon monoxide dehydrogenase subunit G
MDIAGNYTFDAPQKMVWDALQDPNVLGSIMPGGKGFEKVADNQYKGVLEVKVGPVQGIFQGEINLSDIVEPDSYQMQVDGKGAPGFVKATGKVHLETRDSHTFMEYSGQAHVGGRIASVGQRLMDSAARSIIRQSLEALNEYLKVQSTQNVPAAAVTTAPPTVSASISQSAAVEATEPSPTPASTFKPPSQTALTINLIKDVVNDFVPAKYQPWLFGAIILAILIIILMARREPKK